MAVRGLPVGVLLVMIFLTELATPPFDAARAALLPELLPGEEYPRGSALVSTAQQGSLFLGVALGGLLLTVLSTSTALLADAATYLGSAALLWAGLPARSAPVRGAATSLLRETALGLRAVFGDRRIRLMVLGAWFGCSVAIVPEGLAPSYAAALHAPAYAPGLLLMGEPIGGTLLGLLVARWASPALREALMWPLLAAGALPLLAMGLRPGLTGACLLLFASGLTGAGLLVVTTTVGREVAPAVRGRVFGVCGSGLMACQGLALFGGGALASVLPVSTVISVDGAVGLLVLGALAVLARSRAALAARVVEPTVLSPAA